METRFFNGGHCRQLLALIDRRSWRWAHFYAVFFAVRHPQHGWVLIDTGYGRRFGEATQSWPYRLYRWATPATMVGSTGDILRKAKINPAEVRHVVITHFHADHIGGLAEFPQACIHHHADAWRTLAALQSFRQVRSAFLPALIPAWLGTTSHAIEPAEFKPSPDLPFPIHDLFGDGAISLVSLPGHAPGHLGVLISSEEGPLLYSTDAFWHADQIEAQTDLMAPILRLQWDGIAYGKTIRQLRDVARAGRFRLFACHAAETQSLIHAAAGPS